LNILALETSSQYCSVALACRGEVQQRSDESKLSHSRQLLPLLSDLMASASLGYGDLDCIAVSRGPGSFTGLRIGIAVAQGLGFASDLPVVPVSSLAQVAQSAADCGMTGAVLATLDARMGELYAGCYDLCVDGPKLLGGEQVLPPQQIDRLLAAEDQDVCRENLAAIVGGGLTYRNAFPDTWQALLQQCPRENLQPHAEVLLRLAASAFSRGEAVVAEVLTPVYLRNKVVS